MAQCIATLDLQHAGQLLGDAPEGSLLPIEHFKAHARLASGVQVMHVIPGACSRDASFTGSSANDISSVATRYLPSQNGGGAAKIVWRKQA